MNPDLALKTSGKSPFLRWSLPVIVFLRSTNYLLGQEFRTKGIVNDALLSCTMHDDVGANTDAALEFCDELWFTRNLMFHKAGYCFSSTLGKTVFGNEGCKTDEMTISAKAKAVIAKARRLEAENSCDIDTSQKVLAVPALPQRIALVDVPFPTLGESGCIGWQGERLALRSEQFEDGAVIGAARKSDTLLFEYEDADGWSFITVILNDIPVGMGWAKVTLEGLKCDSFAG